MLCCRLHRQALKTKSRVDMAAIPHALLRPLTSIAMSQVPPRLFRWRQRVRKATARTLGKILQEALPGFGNLRRGFLIVGLAPARMVATHR